MRENATRGLGGQRDRSLWDFAVDLYAAPGAADACLALQDRLGCDVSVVLFAAWMGWIRRDRVTGGEMAEIAAQVAAWRDEIVRPLRAIRRRLKSGPSPAPSAATDELRTHLKAAELESERIELLQLEALARRRQPTGDDPAKASLDNLTHAVRLFAAGLDAEATQLIQVIHSAVAEKLAHS
jgi:uncharacterized protein (TIGR02444 family)